MRKSKSYRAISSRVSVAYTTIEVGFVVSVGVAMGEGLALGILALSDHYTGTAYTVSLVNFVKDQIINNIIPTMIPKITDSVTTSLLAVGGSATTMGFFSSWGYTQVTACCTDPRRQGYDEVPQDDPDSKPSAGYVVRENVSA